MVSEKLVYLFNRTDTLTFSPNHFTRIVKKVPGISPKEYRIRFK